MWDDRPQIRSEVQWLADGFVRLAKTRLVGAEGTGPILYTEIVAYMDLYGIVDLEDRRHFANVVRLMDQTQRDRAKEKTTSDGGDSTATA